jgi:hypothetical protein
MEGWMVGSKISKSQDSSFRPRLGTKLRDKNKKTGVEE